MFKIDATLVLSSINVRSEKHGDEKEPAIDLKFSGTLPVEAVIQLYGNVDLEDYKDLYWNDSGNLKIAKGPAVAFTKKLEKISFAMHESFIEQPKEVVISDEAVSLKGFKAAFHEGHRFESSFTVQIQKVTGEQLKNLVEYLEKSVFVCLEEKQISMDLEEPPELEEVEDEEDEVVEA